jgi:hypothetical protein
MSMPKIVYICEDVNEQIRGRDISEDANIPYAYDPPCRRHLPDDGGLMLLDSEGPNGKENSGTLASAEPLMSLFRVPASTPVGPVGKSVWLDSVVNPPPGLELCSFVVNPREVCTIYILP